MKTFNYILLLLILCSQPIFANQCDQHVAFISAMYKKISDTYTQPAEIRYEAIGNILSDSLDIDNISKSVLNSHWKTLSEGQQTEFKNLYKKYLVKHFANIIVEYFGKMEIKSNRPIKHFDGCITTVAFMYHEEPFYVSYFTINKSDGIHIFDMAFEQVRTVMVHRDEFRSKIRSSGIDGLMSLLRNEEDKS